MDRRTRRVCAFAEALHVSTLGRDLRVGLCWFTCYLPFNIVGIGL